jgi:AraC-like DNA-binding protein
MPPHAYLVQIRLLRAKALLRRGRPIAHVASATGFADQSHFTRHFKRLMGVTPAKYAGQGKNVQDVSL